MPELQDRLRKTELRERIPTACLDAFEALGTIPWTDRTDFREAMAATLAKSPDDRPATVRAWTDGFAHVLESAEPGPSGWPEDLAGLGSAAALADTGGQVAFSTARLALEAWGNR